MPMPYDVVPPNYLHSDITPYLDEYPLHSLIIIAEEVMTLSPNKNSTYPHDPQ